MEIGITKCNSQSSVKLDNFYGINRGTRPAMGEMEDMENISSDDFPCVSTCGNMQSVATATGEIIKPVAPDSAFTDEITGFTGVSGNAFYYNGLRRATIRGSRTSNALAINLPDNCEWEIEKMGDMYIINGFNRESRKSHLFYYDIETDIFGYGAKTMHGMIVMVGNDSTGTYIEALRQCGDVEDYIVNYSDGTSFNCRDYSRLYTSGGGSIMWTDNLWKKFFKVGDEITIEGFRDTNDGQYFNLENETVVPDTLKRDYSMYNTVDIDDLGTTDNVDKSAICKIAVTQFSSVTNENSRHKVYIKAYDKNGKECQYLSMSPDNAPVWCAGIKIAVKVPALNRICVHQGRIWGTSPSGRYIYASASDNIFSFSTADMVDNFAWRMPADTWGVCTAVKSYNGELVVFKEEAISVVSGYSVRNYQMNTIKGIGAIAPCSVVVTPRGIIFLSYQGFTLYNGGIPTAFGEKLGKKYTDAVSGFDGRRYYASATDKTGGCEFIVYDTRTDMWHRESDFKATGVFSFRDGMYCCDNSTVYKLHSDFNNVEWSITPAKLYGFELGGINEIWVRAEIKKGGGFTVMTMDRNEWYENETFTQSGGVMVYRAPVRFNKSNTLALKIKGRGKVIIHSIELATSYGGRRYKERS